MDISNGVGVGVALFVSGCDLMPKCKGCFNSSAWDFNAGKAFTPEIEKQFLDLADNVYIDRISILGGDPLSYLNEYDVLKLVESIRERFGNNINIWLYSGYTFEDICNDINKWDIVSRVDVLVDGRYIEDEKDPNLRFRGSKNQRIIDVPATIDSGDITELEIC